MKQHVVASKPIFENLKEKKVYAVVPAVASNSRLPAELIGTDAIQVTTPERWQGLQRAVMIAVHPLSGVQTPSAFDLETGRLCVMASRHKAACIFITRDHVGDTLNSHLRYR